MFNICYLYWLDLWRNSSKSQPLIYIIPGNAYKITYPLGYSLNEMWDTFLGIFILFYLLDLLYHFLDTDIHNEFLFIGFLLRVLVCAVNCTEIKHHKIHIFLFSEVFLSARLLSIEFLDLFEDSIWKWIICRTDYDMFDCHVHCVLGVLDLFIELVHSERS